MEYFVYVHGVSSPAAARLIRSAGYRAAFTTLHGALRPGNDVLQLPRVAAACTLTHLRYQFTQLKKTKVEKTKVSGTFLP